VPDRVTPRVGKISDKNHWWVPDQSVLTRGAYKRNLSQSETRIGRSLRYGGSAFRFSIFECTTYDFVLGSPIYDSVNSP
jgi:hypothetical protein